MNTGLNAIVISLLLFCLFLYFVINRLKSSDKNPNNSLVKITSDGIHFPKPSTTEGYFNQHEISCIKPEKISSEDFDKNIHGFKDYASYKADRLSTIDKMWGENGWCKDLVGVGNEGRFLTAYQYHEGDYSEPIWDYDTNKCTFQGLESNKNQKNIDGGENPYACIYRQVNDWKTGKISGFHSTGLNPKFLEVEIYRDYKAGKLKPFLDSIGYNTAFNFYINDEGKLTLSKKGSGDRPSQKMVIIPGYNYPIELMLVATAITMADNGINMPNMGIPMTFESLPKKRIMENMQKDLVDDSTLYGGETFSDADILARNAPSFSEEWHKAREERMKRVAARDVTVHFAVPDSIDADGNVYNSAGVPSGPKNEDEIGYNA